MKNSTKHSLKFAAIIGLANLLFLLQTHAQEMGSSFAGQKDDMFSLPLNPVKDTVQLLYESKPYQYVTGAVSSVSGEKLSNIPGSNRLNILSGFITGFALYNVDGLPGYENAGRGIRGFHTNGPNRSPLVLINGRVDDVGLLDPYDIESITVLKDAATSVLYGLRSTNGVILITTKQGNKGKVKVSYNTETSFSQPTRMPKFLDSYHYAMLYNEAMRNDDPYATVRYDETALNAYLTGSDPYRYPNVNWTEEFLKDYSVQTRHNINVRGGGETAKYYVSAHYLHDSGLFNTDGNINTYNTNSAIDVLNAHGNVELNISKDLTLFTDLRMKKDKRNAPGPYNTNYDEGIFSALFSRPFNAHPITNPDGSLAGTNDYSNNPYGLLNYRGYSVWERTSLSTFVELVYDLGSLVKGLKLKANAGYNNYNDYRINRTKDFAVYQLNADGETYNKIGLDSEIGNSGDYTAISRMYDHSVSLTYTGEFGRHNLDALLMYDRRQIDNGLSTTLTRNFQGPKGRLSYRYDNRYLIDLAAAYEGSEQYPKSDRYGLFPAVSVGWIISNEQFMQNAKFIDFLKIRGSYGQTGNQGDTYFGYLGSFATGPGAVFGTTPANQGGYLENSIANPLITWEKSLKTNVGIDLALFQNRLTASFDYFNEENRDILIDNAITGMYGASVFVPEGKFKNSGYEIQVGWNEQMKDFEYYLNFNYAVAQNEIVYMNEQYRNYPWMYRTGNPLNSRYGYVFDRFFTEEDDIAALPDQSLLGTQKPGDLKYKDLNEDGVIDDNDIANIGLPKMPEINYGIDLGFRYKGVDITALFQGIGRSTTYKSGYTYWDFHNKIGNVLEHHLDRWRPGSGQSAGYPRLTLSNTNNYVLSSYWVEDNSFLRFKYLEIGYTLPITISRKAGMSKARIFINGNNLYSWDKIGYRDPELPDEALAYPIQRTFSVGLNLQF